MLKQQFIEIVTKRLRKFWEKFVEISGKHLGINDAKIKRKFLGN